MVALALAATLLGAALSGCSKPAQPDSSADASAEKPLPRYWLKNTPLLDRPGGKEIRKVKGPVLVELLVDGRVRSLPGAADSFEGYLPEEVLHSPQDQQGLMLYVQRTTPFTIDQAGESKGGRIYRGTLVSVVPGEMRRALVGYFPFSDLSTVYVERSALGIEPQPLEPPKKEGQLRAVLWLADDLKLNELNGGIRPLLGCVDAWIRKDSSLVSQYVNGIELIGYGSSYATDWELTQPLNHLSTWCPAHAVAKDGDRLVLTEPEPHGKMIKRETTAVPEGYERFEPPADDSLVEAIERSRPIYWLRIAEGKPACDRWTFKFLGKQVKRGRATLRAGLVSIGPEDLVERGYSRWLWHSVKYEPSDGSRPAYLTLEKVRVGGRNICKCIYEQSYALLRAGQDELLMMTRWLPDQLVAYDPGDAERWFLSQAACEKARDWVTRQLEEDGTRATRMGFHAYGHEFELIW